MSVIFLTTVLPGERRTGSEVASQCFVDAMRSTGRRVHVVAYRRLGTDPPFDEDDCVAGERPIESDSAGARAALWMARAVAGHAPYSAAKYMSRRYRAMARALVGTDRDSIVVVDHAQIGWARPKGARFIYIAHNVEHDVYAEDARAARSKLKRWANRREAGLIADVERQLTRDACETWTLSAGDASALSAVGADGRTRVFGLPGADGRPARATDPEVDVGLLGGWTWGLNSAALHWFLEQVRPLLPSALSICVAGPGSDWARGRFANVTLAGMVDDPAGFLQRAKVIAVPSVAGAGVQIKMLDAIASGRQVVASPTALWGIDDPPRTVQIADTREQFAAAIERAAGRGIDEGDLEAARAWGATRASAFRDSVATALNELAPSRTS